LLRGSIKHSAITMTLRVVCDMCRVSKPAEAVQCGRVPGEGRGWAGAGGSERLLGFEGCILHLSAAGAELRWMLVIGEHWLR
jgi:hypothetical protein